MDNFNLRKYLAEGKLLKEYDVDYFEVYNDGENVDIKFDSRGKAQRFIDGMMDNYKKEEEERYEKYAEMFKDNPEDMLYDPNPVPKYTIGYDSESYSMEEQEEEDGGVSYSEAHPVDKLKKDYGFPEENPDDIKDVGYGFPDENPESFDNRLKKAGNFSDEEFENIISRKI